MFYQQSRNYENWEIIYTDESKQENIQPNYTPSGKPFLINHVENPHKF